MVSRQWLLSVVGLLQQLFFEFLLPSNSCYDCRIICNRADGFVFGINSSRIVNRKEIVLSFASYYFTPSYLQCSHY